MPHSHRQSTLGSDIPYIIEPAYSRQRSYSTTSSVSGSPTSSCPLSRTTTFDAPIYIDSMGRPHDPSYRMFAVPATSLRRNSDGSNVTTLSQSSQSRAADQRRKHRAFAQGRSTVFDDVLDESDEEELVNERTTSSPMFSNARYPSPSYSRSTSPGRAHTSPPSSPLPYPTRGSLPNYSPPDPESPFVIHSDHEDGDESSDDDTPIGPKPPRHLPWSKKPTSEKEDIQPSPSHPTSLRHQWESLSLRVQVRAHRTKQKLHSRLHPTPPHSSPASVLSF